MCKEARVDLINSNRTADERRRAFHTVRDFLITLRMWWQFSIMSLVENKGSPK